MLFYYKLKVTIDDYELKSFLGIDLIKKSIPLDSIERCGIGKRKWYYRHHIH
ncbi:MAG: hypothetical protein U9Q80_06940 [Bacillota bacterium]|nr:hypothetical protein [Bacillota bacterium]